MKLGQLGMFDCEWARLAVSNEIKIEPRAGQAVDGTLLKKFASGGDTVKARVMRANAVPLKIQAGLLMMVNDFPEVKPSDALETCVSFSFPCKFLKAGDARIGTGCYKARPHRGTVICLTHDQLASRVTFLGQLGWCFSCERAFAWFSQSWFTFIKGPFPEGMRIAPKLPHYFPRASARR